MVDEEYLRKAHKEGATRNWNQVKLSKYVGCFCCLRIISSKSIIEYCIERDGEKTAICASCGIDSILCDAGDFTISIDILEKMNEYWF